ncbi:cyclophilin-type peptidyl-prolyl cis-trans isomerase [Dunaliella salina]|uniref:peptidylprolyl isomerase n=1 Tax=Dunaliella salina TaxID=3046 RepID=A0ABQ7G822_DUNSA|nr:cyclophilin-type peptidyl-prolyl cis-trans isomerase [Dunaliella salina]|eukprot:KAF5830762.1 cyclophilin-type peptidyl-prolyl cis-trans isomerase [Dunaliella salina]
MTIQKQRDDRERRTQEEAKRKRKPGRPRKGQAQLRASSSSSSKGGLQPKVPVPEDVRGKELDLEVHVRRLSLRLRGQPILEGSLADAGEVDIDACFWTLEETPGGKVVDITLAKKAMGYNNWEALLEMDRADLSITDRVFMEVQVGGQVLGKIAIGLFGNAVPLTTSNFKALCTGEKGTGTLGKPLHFKGSPFHRIIPGFMMQGGDITDGNGTGGESIYGPSYDDENFSVKHEEAGFVACANAGPNTNSSQFYIPFGPAPHLNGRHVVFGRVLAGMDVVRRVEAVGSASGAPSEPVVIADCGVLDNDAAVEKVMDSNKMLALDRDA